MRHLPLPILVATFGLSGCAFDTGKAPSQGPYVAPNGSGETAADATSSDVDGSDSESLIDTTQSAGDGDSIGSTGGPTDTVTPTTPGGAPLPTVPWTTSFTTTLQGDGLTLQPLGARRGFTGVLSAPDGTLHLEALP